MIELLILWVIVSVVFNIGRVIADSDRGSLYFGEPPKKGRIKTNLNAIALALNIYDYLKTVDYHKLITPKTPIQKEIEEKRKEIDQLKKQKADMEELERLTKEEEALFYEKKDREAKLKQRRCFDCGGMYEGDRCHCTYAVDPLPMLRGHNSRYTPYFQTFPVNTVEECPHCRDDIFGWEYTKDKLIQSCKNCDVPVGFIK